MKKSTAGAADRTIGQFLASRLSSGTFWLCAALVAGVEWTIWRNASSVEPVSHEGGFSPYLLGLFAGLFAATFWVLLSGVLAMLTGRPQGRWVALGLGLLMLASLAPLAWHYRQTDATEPTQAQRVLDVGLGLAVTITIASLLPRPLRAGLGLGLFLCFCLLPALGAILAAICEKVDFPLRLLGIDAPDAIEIIIRAMEYALIGGIGLGLLVGAGAWCGWVTVQPASRLSGAGESAGTQESKQPPVSTNS